MKFKTKDLKIAEVRYYDALHKGIEYTPPISHVILCNNNGHYENVLMPGDICPVYSRVLGTTNAYSTEDYYGTKIEHVSGNEESGEVFLLTGKDLSSKFLKPVVTLREVEDFVLYSDSFYHNRVDIVQRRLDNDRGLINLDRIRLVRIKVRDAERQKEMENFFAARGVKKVMQK